MGISSKISFLEGKSLIWVGPRYSDILYTGNLFSGAITLYGPNSATTKSYCSRFGRRVNHNITTEGQSRFIEDELHAAISRDDTAMFMSYDPNLVFGCSAEVRHRTVCLNEESVMRVLNQKTTFRRWAQDTARTQKSTVLDGSQCSHSAFCQLLGDSEAFVVQKNDAPGGEGTLLVGSGDDGVLQREIGAQESVLVSPYVKNNIPLNIHVLIYEHEVVLLPFSIQIIGPDQGKFLYRGADYIAARELDSDLASEFTSGARAMGEKLRICGYRGLVCFDAIAYNGHVYFLECNNRFQGSTMPMNRALHERGLPSVQEMVLQAFECGTAPFDLHDFSVNCSSYSYETGADGAAPHLPSDIRNARICLEAHDDAFEPMMPADPHAFMFRAVFSANITSIDPEGSVSLHPNVREAPAEWYEAIAVRKSPLHLKIALMNQGVVVDGSAREFLERNGGLREGVHHAIDLVFPGIEDLVVNSPIDAPFTDLSPFRLVAFRDGLALTYYDGELLPVSAMPHDGLSGKTTKGDVPLHDICLIATDRVRLQHTHECAYRQAGVACAFCEVNSAPPSKAFTLQDAFEAIDAYLESPHDFRHFLIGGRTQGEGELESTLALASYIKRRCGYPVYLMTVPPDDLAVLTEYERAGITEVAFNIEIWDREAAREFMPGKGLIPLDRYLAALEAAVRIWGPNGAVRSCFVVGLESTESLMEGVEVLSRMGVAPVLSAFRPIPGTPCEGIVPPSNDRLFDVCSRAQKICEEHGLGLGPSCAACQNNTLSLPAGLLGRES